MQLHTAADPAENGWVGDYLHDPAHATLRLLAALRDAAAQYSPVAIPVALLVIAAWVVTRRWWRARCRAALQMDARRITVLAPPQVDPAGGAALWSNLVGLLRPAWRRWWAGQPHLALEYVFGEHGVTVQVWVPGVIPPGLVERAIESAWPGAHTRTHPAASPLPALTVGHRRLTLGGHLRLARSEALPLRTGFDADPIRALLGAPVGLSRAEHACVQILARPVTGRRVAQARRAARRVNHASTGRLAGRILDAFTPGASATRRGRTPEARRISQNPRLSLEYSAQNKAIVAKQRGSQYETLVRYVAATDLPADAGVERARQARATARGRAHALAAAFAAYTEHNHYTRSRLRHPATALRERRLDRGDLLSVPELAALAHLPTDAEIPGVERAGAKAVAPPPGVAVPGPEVLPLGHADTGDRRPVGLRVSDGRHHLHVLGATGSGKSTLLAGMVLDDAAHGRGAVVIDPKGDLVTDILSRLPRAVAERVVLFDADSRHRPPILNPLDGHDTDREVDNLVSVFRRIYSAFWGPRTDDLMRAACLTLRAQEGVATLADLPKLLTNEAFRTRITAGLTDPVLAGFWQWYDELTESSRSQVISPLMNKLRAFLLRPFVKEAIAGGRSTVDMAHVLDDGGILLARLPKGSLGEETTRLVGSLIVSSTWQAATARARIPQRLRHDASLTIDEMHNFLNLPYPIDDMLAEARAFRLRMVLAHQHLGQLTRELKEGVSTNARSKIYLSASPEDAHELVRHTAPRLSDHDLSHLDAFHAAVRLVVNGQQTEPFTMTTTPLPPAIPGRAREIRAAHRAQRRTAQQAAPITHVATAPAAATATATTPSRPDATRRVAPSRPPTTDPRRSRP
ncbi:MULTISPECIES: type IV secretory system conjugative DNA transfer family protein [unclassified Amycolatopsis]|uniref:type IV secretory system conjugative DNA transfer family protein n=1 Tax=unclassified Amycolatopsis TaxID=2618356 RepID=UPI001C69444F|nr:type IV secretion system DNA-binding domain-containing protein [Amycolatopsis sp. DSM 110486]QYN20147.1 type IV secretion system DNA-binding domain-containing protein [Amycolatopsis sp. DSM 110486]